MIDPCLVVLKVIEGDCFSISRASIVVSIVPNFPASLIFLLSLDLNHLTSPDRRTRWCGGRSP